MEPVVESQQVSNVDDQLVYQDVVPLIATANVGTSKQDEARRE